MLEVNFKLENNVDRVLGVITILRSAFKVLWIQRYSRISRGKFIVILPEIVHSYSYSI